jgi:hypothetical protein
VYQHLLTTERDHERWFVSIGRRWMGSM